MTTEVFYSKAYIGSSHSFDTTRKSGWVADSLVTSPVTGIKVVAPQALGVKQLSEVHSPKYVNAVRVGYPLMEASSAGFGWDIGLWNAVCASNGGAVAAALSAYRGKKNAGSLSSGLHHASYDMGMGFCTFNGLALAAVAAKRAGAKRVLVIDLDAHCGGGTNSLLKQYKWVESVDISTSPLDSYTPDQERWTLDVIRNPRNYLDRLQRRLQELDDLKRSFDLCIYNSGMDAMELCDIGGLDGLDFATIAKREEIVFSWAKGRNLPTAFVLAGGYSGRRLDQDTLVGLHRLTIAESAK